MVDIRTSSFAARLAAFSCPQKHWKGLIFRGAHKNFLLCRQIGGFFISAEALESAYFSWCPLVVSNNNSHLLDISTSIIGAWFTIVNFTPPRPPPPPSPPLTWRRTHTSGLHYPAPPEVLAAVLHPHAVGIDGGVAEQIRLPPRVIHHQMGGGVAVDDQPRAGAGWPIDGASMDVAAGHRDATGDLLFNQLEVGGLHQPGGDAVVGEDLELGVGIGGVAVALHHR
jgi:hypothetical protein